MKQNRQYGLLVLLAEHFLLRADDAHEHRVDGFEVRRIRSQIHLRLLAVVSREDTRRSEVVLHITGTLHGLFAVAAFEFAEDLVVRLPGDVRQDVEPTAVRHADADLVESFLRGAVEHGVEQRNDRLATFK